MNPREVKRLVNAYTMQMKMLERKLKDQPRAASAPAVLALQVMSFRADWQTTYQALSNNPSDFMDATRDALNRGSSAIAIAEEVIELPPSLVSYLRNEGAPLLDLGDDLDVLDDAGCRSVDGSERARAGPGPWAPARRAQAGAGANRRQRAGPAHRGRRAVRPTVVQDPAAPATTRARELQEALPSEASSLVASEPPGSAAHAQQTALLDTWLADVGRELSPLGQSLTDLRRRTQTSASP